jgi:hypothetical protein
MKNFDLDSELKGLPVPERGEAFWEMFPQRVLEELRATPAPAPLRRTLMPRLAWGFGVALACLVAGFCLGHTRAPKRFCYVLLKDENELRRTVQQFPSHVCGLLQDEHGLSKLVEEQQ